MKDRNTQMIAIIKTLQTTLLSGVKTIMSLNLSRKNLCAILLFFIPVLATSFVRAEYQILDRVVAIVEDDVVLASSVREHIQRIKSVMAKRGGQLPSDQILYEQVLERSILESLQLQRAYKVGIRISDQELNHAMERISTQNGLSMIEFRNMLEKQGQSFVELREKTRKDMLVSTIQQRSVMRNISISKAEVDNLLTSESGQSIMQPEFSIDHILLPISSDASTEALAKAKNSIALIRKEAANDQFIAIAPTISRLGAQHSPLGWRKKEDCPSIFQDIVGTLPIGEISQPIQSGSGLHLIRINQKRGDVSEVTTETLVSHILVTPLEIRSEEQAVELITKIDTALNNGRSFSEMARLYSDDPDSALNNGSLGWIAPDKMVAEFEKVMNATPVGETSVFFKSSLGWHILQVHDRREKDLSTENAEYRARMAIAETKYDDELNNWLQELRDNSFVEIK